MSYTKGPWQIKENKLSGTLNIVSESGYVIVTSKIDTDIIGSKIDKANLSVMAAAPKMLEALKIVEKLSGITWDSKKGKDFEVGAMLHIIREAIKTAEDETGI